jgi:hypothetical protein
VTTVNQKLSRAAQLIERLVTDGAMDVETLARELVIRPQTLADYRAGTVPMPLERQLCLALLVIERSPAHARLGYKLREQVSAAMRYEERFLSPHDGAAVVPPRF